MANKMRAPYRVGDEKKTLNSEFISKNITAISDLMWQGLKFIMTELKSDAPYGDGSPTNLVMRKIFLTQTLENGFHNFYRMVEYSEKEAKILTANAMKIWKSNAKNSVSNIGTLLLVENMFLAKATIARAQKEQKGHTETHNKE